MITVPESLRVRLLRTEDAAKDWINDFPDLADQYLARWHGQVDGPVVAGATAVVIPVRTPVGAAVVKISYPHPSTADEHKALRAWDGDGAVRLFDADPEGHALLLERLAGRELAAPVDEAIAIGGQLSARLAVPAPPDVKRLADTVSEWEQQIRDDHHQAGDPLPARTVDAAVETVRGLGHDDTQTMLHGDLHSKNILHSDRGWIAIDPQGVAGTAAFDALTMCSDRPPEPHSGVDLVREMSHRVEIFSEAAGVDAALSRRCVQARAVTGLLWDLARGDVGRSANFDVRRQLSEGFLG
ncbi:hydroxyurea phosphotransferase [Microlunatus endophyticus]|uniref:Hydroxyurea phosphotransferase n=1 Tax=Microlunatus endophyticus TaxID=1716077 RepID=A0A917W0S5_9ACTN|nr:aminoglycoside phosphotransferase family protein [Microlunatus endophyticus]GGL53306.1 hydroxyurea phosphotransferase [Microlunatus endophyticus]